MPSSWAKGEVEEAIEKKLVPEALRTSYRVDITREEFCELVMEVLKVLAEEQENLKALLNGTSGDVVFDDTSNPAVMKAYRLGIVRGVGERIFAPKRSISRQEAAKMITNLCAEVFRTEISAEAASFADAEKIAGWAGDAVRFVFRQKFMNGVGANRFQPTGVYTREQSILTLLRVYRHYAEEKP